MVVTVFDAVAREKLTRLPLRYRSTEQHFLEARLVPYSDETNVLFAGVFQADPSLSGNEYQRAWLRVLLFVSEPHVSAACLDQENLVLPVMFVLRDHCAGRDLLRPK